MRIRSTSGVVVGAVITIVVAVFAVGIYAVSHKTYTDSIKNQSMAMDNAVASAMAGLDSFVADATFAAETLAQDPSVLELLMGWGDPATVQQQMMDILKKRKIYWVAFVFDKDGTILAGGAADGTDMTGSDRSHREYVQAILDGKDTYISRRIEKSSTGGSPIVVLSHAARDYSGNLIGGVALFPFWNTMVQRYISPVRLGETGYGFIIDANGVFLAHPDADLVLNEERQAEPFLKQAVSQGEGDLQYSWRGEDKLMRFQTYPKTGWLVGMCADMDDLASTAIQLRTMLILGGAVSALIIIGVIMFCFRRLVQRPLMAMHDYVGQIAGGDYKAVLEGSFRYEMADMAGALDTMVGQLKERLGFAQGLLNNLPVPTVVSDLEGRVNFVNGPMLTLLGHDGHADEYFGRNIAEFIYADASKRVATRKAMENREPVSVPEVALTNRSGREIVASVDAAPLFDLDGELTGAFVMLGDLTLIKKQQRDIEAQNRKIAEVAASAADIAARVASASEELSTQVEQSSKGAEKQRRRATETATAMEQMSASIMEVARNASDGAESADQARETALNGEDMVRSVERSVTELSGTIQGLKDSMNELGGHAEGVGTIMNVISDIADQTNLLALNAAIEAARAGEAGRGFAVVADEVRKLAEKTMTATKEVGQAVGAIQEGTRRSVRGTEESAESVAAVTDLARQAGQFLQQIVTMASQTSDQVRAIATAAEEQSAASEEINQGTEEISRISGETSDAMRQSSEAVQALAQLAGSLNELMEDMTR